MSGLLIKLLGDSGGQRIRTRRRRLPSCFTKVWLNRDVARKFAD